MNLEDMSREDLIKELLAERERKGAVLRSLLNLQNYYNVQERLIGAQLVTDTLVRFLEQDSSHPAYKDPATFRRAVEEVVLAIVTEVKKQAEAAKPR